MDHQELWRRSALRRAAAEGSRGQRRQQGKCDGQDEDRGPGPGDSQPRHPRSSRGPGPEPAARPHERVAANRQRQGAGHGQHVAQHDLHVGLGERALDGDQKGNVNEIDPEARGREIAQNARFPVHVPGQKPPDPEQRQPADEADGEKAQEPELALFGQDPRRTDVPGEVGVVVEEVEGGNRDRQPRRRPQPGAPLEHLEEVLLAAQQPAEAEEEAEVREQGRDRYQRVRHRPAGDPPGLRDQDEGAERGQGRYAPP